MVPALVKRVYRLNIRYRRRIQQKNPFSKIFSEDVLSGRLHVRVKYELLFAGFFFETGFCVKVGSIRLSTLQVNIVSQIPIEIPLLLVGYDLKSLFSLFSSSEAVYIDTGAFDKGLSCVKP
jgi:hypothetical protein